MEIFGLPFDDNFGRHELLYNEKYTSVYFKIQE